MSPRSLAKVNNLSLKSILHVGQQLYVPKGTKRAVESIAYLQPSTIPIKESLVNLYVPSIHFNILSLF